MSDRNWHNDFTVFRESDYMVCHVWAMGGTQCLKPNHSVPVVALEAGSHRTVGDYVRAAEKHLLEQHPTDERVHQ